MQTNNPLQIKPNVPLRCALQDPQGTYDFDFEQGIYLTTSGQSLTLPRPAVVLLNALDPQPGEEIIITRHWNGKMGSKSEWTVALSARSENERAKAEETPQDLAEQLEASIEHERERRRSLGDPTPIRRPSKRAPAPEVQPRLFDRGTGTHGPAPAIQPEDVPRSIPLPAVAIGRQQRPGQIPADQAVKEILQFIQADPNTANWGDQAKQDLLSTVFIGFIKQGVIGIWQR
jgi:hypothetical protein